MDNILITTEDLKKLTAISQNMDVELLDPHLLIAQQLYVAPVLGTALYQKIMTDFESQSLSGNNLTLYNDYIIPALAYSAWFSSAPFLHFKTQRAGIGTQGGESVNPVNVEELSLYISRVEGLKNHYIKRLQDYLEDNKTLYPLYYSDSTVSQNKPNNGGLYLGFKSKNTNDNWWV